MAALAVLLTHSTDEPERTVSAIRAARHAAERRQPAGAPGPVLVLDHEGARLAAKGVAETLHGDGRPDVRAMLDAFQAAGGRVLVVADAWRERGYRDDALATGAGLAPPDLLARLADEGYAVASY